ncbi:hypothetical protein ACU4GD_03850 [Cupriavidus basilensis]
MLLLALPRQWNSLENIMFVFASSHIVGGVDADPRSFALVQAASRRGQHVDDPSSNNGWRNALAIAITLPAHC